MKGKKETKKTRLLYRDEKNLLLLKSIHKMDRGLLGDLFLGLMEYDRETGEIPEVIIKNEDTIIYPIFLDYVGKIDVNESKYERRVRVSQENGKKGGRPKKEAVDTEAEEMAVPEYGCLNDTGYTLEDIFGKQTNGDER